MYMLAVLLKFIQQVSPSVVPWTLYYTYSGVLYHIYTCRDSLKPFGSRGSTVVSLQTSAFSWPNKYKSTEFFV